MYSVDLQDMSDDIVRKKLRNDGSSWGYFGTICNNEEVYRPNKNQQSFKIRREEK